MRMSLFWTQWLVEWIQRSKSSFHGRFLFVDCELPPLRLGVPPFWVGSKQISCEGACKQNSLCEFDEGWLIPPSLGSPAQLGPLCQADALDSATRMDPFPAPNLRAQATNKTMFSVEDCESSAEEGGRRVPFSFSTILDRCPLK